MSMDVELDAGFWDERYRSADALWSGEPNAQLIAEVSELAPGSALDVGCGEGADAIWLAQRGWRVTAIDISGVALERGRAQAAVVGDDVARRIEWLCADILTWEPPAGAYDLVSAQFIHFANPQRDAFFRRLSARSNCRERSDRRPPPVGLADDGAPVAHARLLLHRARRRGVTRAGALGRSLAEARPREVTDPEGQTITVNDVVVRARRCK